MQEIKSIVPPAEYITSGLYHWVKRSGDPLCWMPTTDGMGQKNDEVDEEPEL